MIEFVGLEELVEIAVASEFQKEERRILPVRVIERLQDAELFSDVLVNICTFAT